MIVQCIRCGRNYDDENCWTLCPHGPLEYHLDDYCYKCDTLKSIHGPCKHQIEESQNESGKT